MEIEINNVYAWKVVFIAKTHLIAKTIDGEHTGLLHVSEISDYYVGSISTLFKLNEIYDFLVIENKEKDKVKLSWKKIAPRFLKNPFEYNIIETKKGFTTLKEFIEKEV